MTSEFVRIVVQALLLLSRTTGYGSGRYRAKNLSDVDSPHQVHAIVSLKLSWEWDILEREKLASFLGSGICPRGDQSWCL